MDGKSWERRCLLAEKTHKELIQSNAEMRSEYYSALAKIKPLERYKEVAEGLLQTEHGNTKIAQKERINLTSQLTIQKKQLRKVESEKKILETRCAQALSALTECCQRLEIQTVMVEETEMISVDLRLALEQLVKKKEECEAKDAFALKLGTDLTENKQELQQKSTAIIVLKAEKKKLIEKMTTMEESSKDYRIRLQDKAQRLCVLREKIQSFDVQERKRTAQISDLETKLKHSNENVATEAQKVHLRDDTIRHYRHENLMLRGTIADLKNELQTMTSERNRLCRLLQDSRDQITIHEQSIQHNIVELNCTRAENKQSKSRIEELAAQVACLREANMKMQQELIQQLKTEEERRKKQIASDRKALKIEMERLMMNKQCTRCQQTYTEKTNSAGTCCYHPGRLVERNYPFHGFAWTCCQKPDKNALPCTLGGRHTDTSCHSDTKQPEQQLDSEDLAPWHFDAS